MIDVLARIGVVFTLRRINLIIAASIVSKRLQGPLVVQEHDPPERRIIGTSRSGISWRCSEGTRERDRIWKA